MTDKEKKFDPNNVALKDEELEFWYRLFRASVLTNTVTKFFSYVRLADQKCQAMIVLNTIIIPVALSWIERPEYKLGATISIVTALISIMTGIICIYPKRRTGKKPDGTRNLLHFSDVGYMTEAEYLAEMQPMLTDTRKLSVIVLKDIHDVSRRILRPKFFWLKLSYLSFFIGNLIALGFILYNLPH